jgi:hypothetical protein
MEDQ